MLDSSSSPLRAATYTLLTTAGAGAAKLLRVVKRFRLVVCALLLALFALVPGRARADQDDFWGRDKALHFSFSVVLSAGTYTASSFFFDARYPRLLLGAGVSLGLGAGKELADLAGLGTPSWKDFAWDVIGTATGLLLAYGLDLAIFGVSGAHPAFSAPEPTLSTKPYALNLVPGQVGAQVGSPFTIRF